MTAETSIHICILSGFGIEKRKLPVGSFQREDLGRRMAGSFFTELWIAGIAKSCREPNAALFIDHSVMVVRSGIPNLLAAPIRRRLHELIARCMTRTERFGDAIAHRRDDR